MLAAGNLAPPPSERRFFLLAASDGFNEAGRVPAFRVASTWLELGSWPIYPKTKSQGLMAKGDRILFYLAGKRRHSQHFIAEAEVGEIVKPNNAHLQLSDEYFMGPPVFILSLVDIKMFDPMRSIRPFIGRTELLKYTGPRWAAGLMGGSRVMSLSDYIAIAGSKPGT